MERYPILFDWKNPERGSKSYGDKETVSKQRKLTNKAEEKRFYAKRLKELSVHVASEGQLLFLAISQYLLP